MSFPISAVDLFCGVGGLTFGLSQAGIDVRLGVDIDPASQHPFEHNSSATFLQADVTELSANTVFEAFTPGAFKLLAGCAPCQPFSTYAQKTKNQSDSNSILDQARGWRLVERFGEIIEEVRPELVAMENVPPLLRAPVYARLLRSLDGYSIDARVVDCKAIGLPQSRKRLVLVASRLGPISLPQPAVEEKTVRSTIEHLPPLCAGGVDPDDRLHRASALSSVNLRRIQASVPGGTWRDWPADLRAACHLRETGTTYPSVYGRMVWDEPAPTITTQCFGYGNGRFGHPTQDRAISLREAAMLQGFPRDYSFLPDDQPISFATLGRLIGNAVPVTLGKFIGDVLTSHMKNSGC